MSLRAPGGQSEPQKTERGSAAKDNPKAIDERLQDEEMQAGRLKGSTSELAEQDSQSVSDLMLRAEDALALKDQKTAAKIYQEVVRLQPTHKVALHRLAILFDMNGNFAQADHYFRRALEFAPDDPTLLNDLGYAYLRQQRLDESRDYLQASMNIDPDNQTTLRNIGILLALQGNPHAAQEFFQRGGLTDEEAHREFASFLSSISRPGESSHPVSIAELSKSKNIPAASGQFAPPSTDLESTYGLKSDSSPRESDRTALDSRGLQNVAGTAELPAGRRADRTGIDFHDESNGETDSVSSESASGMNDLHYDLERAALNSGPGGLFPVAAFDSPDNRQPKLRPPFAGLRDWNTVQPAGFGEPETSEIRVFPPYDSNTSRERESPFIQSPTGR
ncbi:MAG TPA: tetratricopeptide repeat protein, partial [Planctomycetaceae bacterium]|nr:tetratricopeptide repeat protein [Planctomycetaceae bacterium]